MNTLTAHYFDGRFSRAHPVCLAVADNTLRIEGEGIQRTIPLRETELTASAGAATRFIRLADGARCEVADSAGLDELLRNSEHREGRLAQWIKRLEQKSFLVAAAALLLTTTLVTGFFVVMPRLTARLASAVPYPIAKQLSIGTLHILDAQVFNASQLRYSRTASLRRQLQDLLTKSGYVGLPVTLQFRSMPNGVANAFALPDGILIVTDALVESAGSDEEILAVLAHEVGQVDGRHALRLLLQDSALFVLAASAVGDASAVMNMGGALPLALVSKKYSREFEEQADRYAMNLLRKAGMDHTALAAALRRLQKQNPGGEPPVYLSTHPPTEARIRAIETAAVDAP